MRKLIAAINMTMDGYCDHTSMMPGADIHQHYTDLLNSAGSILYGRITYQLMEDFWPGLVQNPSGEKAFDEFAIAIDRIPKIVFSRTLKTVNWHSARLAKKSFEEEVAELKSRQSDNIIAGSRSIVNSLISLDLVDELQLCLHPVIPGNSTLSLFDNIKDRKEFRLSKTKTFDSGAILLYYEPLKK